MQDSRDQVRFLGDKTLDVLVRQVESELTATGSRWTATDAGFDSWLRETMDPGSMTRTGHAAVWAYVLSPRLLDDVADIVERVDALLDILGGLERPPTVLFSNVVADPVGVLPLTRGIEKLALALQINARLETFRAKHSWFHIVDMAGLAARHGLANLTDARYEAMAQMYFSPRGARLVAGLWARALRALERPQAKVCIVDLDNTLWRGILGEDGADGLQMGPAAAGFPFRRLQLALLELKRNGILLAVCSKNNREEALSVLATHPDCLLRPTDFAATEISWEPKSAGIRRIAARLNLGLDAMVFLDDSPFERSEVRTALPMVRVPDFPEDPTALIATLADETCFDTLRVTSEDRQRAQSYLLEAQRESLRESAESPEEFFRSLKLKVQLFPASEAHLERLHQLILKTNQFNLTAERMSADEFRSLATDPGWLVVGLRVSDCFGDSGVTGLAIVDRGETSAWKVRNFLLSCRVIGRTVEHAVVHWLATLAGQSGVSTLQFAYHDSGRNQVARQFLEKSGLTPDVTGTVWSIRPDDCAQLAAHYVTLDFQG